MRLTYFLFLQLNLRVPAIYSTNSQSNEIIFEYIENSLTAKEYIEESRQKRDPEQFKVFFLTG